MGPGSVQQCYTVTHWCSFTPNLGTSELQLLLVCWGSYRLEKYMSLEGFFEQSLKIKHALKGIGKSHICLEKSLNSSTFCRNEHY